MAEKIEVVIDGKTWLVDREFADEIGKVMEANESSSVIETINGVHPDIVRLLDELYNVNWFKAVPDTKSRQLISLAMYIGGMGAAEAAYSLSCRDPDEFNGDNFWGLGSDAGRVAIVIQSGEF